MKTILYCSTFFMLLASMRVTAQINFKTEYISSSTYKNKEAHPRHAEGNLKVIQGSFRIPVSIKMNENNRLWRFARFDG